MAVIVSLDGNPIDPLFNDGTTAHYEIKRDVQNVAVTVKDNGDVSIHIEPVVKLGDIARDILHD